MKATNQDLQKNNLIYEKIIYINSDRNSTKRVDEKRKHHSI